jgi:hypothetical protein
MGREDICLQHGCIIFGLLIVQIYLNMAFRLMWDFVGIMNIHFTSTS